jgi:2-methylaconitate cis-trans-isomerase PrpF
MLMRDIRIRSWIMRGGTSKAVFLMEDDVPADIEQRKQLIRKVIGSPDRRQIDGLGGADPLTSKCAVIGRSTRKDADIDYSFYQVGIDTDVVKPSICGNISAAVGPFAIDEGLVEACEPLTTVAIHNTYTGRILYAEVPVADGKAITHGDFEIAGVPGMGAKILLDWRNLVGVETGALLPTGRVADEIDVAGLGRILVSIVDCGNPAVFVAAECLGLTGTELPDVINGDAILKAKVELVRGTAAEMVGLVADHKQSATQNPNHPFLVLVSHSASYPDYAGRVINAEDTDIVARAMFMQVMHRAYPGTGALCTGVAAMIEGTVVHRVVRKPLPAAKLVRIGHPGGVMDVEVDVARGVNGYEVRRAAVARTARRIMDGYSYVSL